MPFRTAIVATGCTPTINEILSFFRRMLLISVDCHAMVGQVKSLNVTSISLVISLYTGIEDDFPMVLRLAIFKGMKKSIHLLKTEPLSYNR